MEDKNQGAPGGQDDQGQVIINDDDLVIPGGAPEAEGEFSLDDILREFSGNGDGANPPAAEDTLTGDTVRIHLPGKNADPIVTENPPAGTVGDAMAGDTVDLGIVTSSAAAVTNDDTIPFIPLGNKEDGEEVPPAAPPVEEEAEPFSEGWEPKYDQPMGEYISPEPTVALHHPKSRLRELKRKLVAGPERRYYELSEIGFGKLQAAIFLSLMVAALASAATFLFEMGIIGPERQKFMVFTQLLAMLVCGTLGCNQLIDGLSDLFRFRLSLNTLLVLSFIACLADGFFCLQQERIPCCAAFTLQVTMSLWSEYHSRSTEMGQMDTLRKAVRLTGLARFDGYYDRHTGLLRTEGQVEDFMDHYQDRSFSDKVKTGYSILSLVVSIGCAVAAGILHNDIPLALQVFSAALLASVPCTFFISSSRPMAILERRLHKLGTVLCGWKQVDRLGRKVAFPLHYEDLFPTGSCKLNGVKFYGKRNTDQVVEYATAVIAASGSGLAPIFTQLLQSRNGRPLAVERLRLYGNGGAGGIVDGEPVLIGCQSFLSDMGVEIPEGTMVSQAVYVSVDGELCGVFAVSFGKSKSSAAGLVTLCSYRGLRPVVTAIDFMLTEDFIRARFGVNTRRMQFPEFALRHDLATARPTEDSPVLALVTTEGLAPHAYALTGARALRTASRLGLAIHLLGGILGLGMMAILAVLGQTQLLTPVNMLLYQLLWTIPGFLITEWTRSV